MYAQKVVSNKEYDWMGLETTAQVHYPYFSKSSPPMIQVWPLPYLKPIMGSHCSQGSKEQSFKSTTLHMEKESPNGQKWTELSKHSPRERITIVSTLVLEAGEFL